MRSALRFAIGSVLLVATAATAAGQAGDRPVVTAVVAPYRLGGGDRLKIVVYGEDKLTGEYAVNGEGIVPFPLVGDVPAKGLTIAEFRAALVRQLSSEFLRHPSVTVEVINFRPVFVLGEVAKPGSVPYAEGMTVYGLVSIAGGFSYRANTRRVMIRHENEAVEMRVPLDSQTQVAPGDTVRVLQRFF